MDKNTGLYIVFGFLLLCILLSLDKKEGFATIDVSEFETACNANGNTCIVVATGALGDNCLPSPDESLYNLSPGEAERDLHRESFNITASSCSESAYPTGESISAQVCSNERQAYTLSGCAAKCSRRADSETGYNVTLPQYVSPTETDSNGAQGIRDIEGSCDDGFMEARYTCFNRDGTINGEPNSERCGEAQGIWYDGTGTNQIKLVCDPEVNPNYSVIGCEPACLSRDSNLDEYITTSDLTNQDKEIIQILHRTDPLTSDATEVIMPQSSETPYLMNESSLNPGAFVVTGTPRTTNFSSEPGVTAIPIDFAGTVESYQGCNLSSPNTDLQRKYPVSGLFPVCNSQTHECLNFNITYDSDAPMNINDFKDTMSTSATEIGISDDDLENYRKSLYYYRRYKDIDDKIHIEGQIRCNNEENSPFHCIITGEETDPITWILGEVGQSCNDACDGIGSTCTISNILNEIDSEEKMQEKMSDAVGGETCNQVRQHGNASFVYNINNRTCTYTYLTTDQFYAIPEDTICGVVSNDNYRPLCKCQG